MSVSTDASTPHSRSESSDHKVAVHGCPAPSAAWGPSQSKRGGKYAPPAHWPSASCRAGAARIGVEQPVGHGRVAEFGHQLTALFTSAPILASSTSVNSVSAKAVDHMSPSSRLAVSLKPNVAYLALNLSALWKKQTTLPSLA